MHDFRLTLRNYRCFRHDARVTLEFRKGFTALVGPNNSGKSTILKFIHEMKNLWGRMAPYPADLGTALKGGLIGVSYPDVRDPLELFCNSNSKGLSFKIELLDIEPEGPGTQTVTGVSGFADRASPTNWYEHQGHDH